MTISIKGKEAKTIEQHVPFIITSNRLPDFGDDAPNVAVRLAIYNIQPLPPQMQFDGVLEVFRKNCMNYVHWIGDQINSNRHLVDPKELFYEELPTEDVSTVEIKRREMTDALRNMPKKVSAIPFETVFGNRADDFHPVSE